MIRRLFARILRAAAALIVVAAIVGVVIELLPGDAAEIRAGRYATEDDIARIRAEQGLDRPAVLRWLTWVFGALRGDLGASAISRLPVADMVAQRLPITATLAGMAMLVAIPLAIAATGPAVAASSRGRRPSGVGITAMVAIPQIVIAAALIALFAGVLRWFPAVSFLSPGVPLLAQPARLVLPIASLAIPAAAFAAVLIRGAAVDAVTAPHVADARLRGLSRRTVAMRYVAGQLVVPITQVTAVVGGSLLAGTALIEAVFGISGLGEMLVTAVATRDVAVVQSVTVIAATAVLTGLLHRRHPGRLRRRHASEGRDVMVSRVALGLFVLALALAGGIFAPHPVDAVVAQPWAGPSDQALLGTDSLGRDVLSRTLAGGRMLAVTALAGGLAATVLGTLMGLIAGWGAGFVDRATRAVADVLLAFPALLAALVLAVALPGAFAVIVGSVVIGAPLTARLVRESTRRMRGAGFVEVAEARGEHPVAVLVREVLPAMSGLVVADAGLRFVVALQLASALGVLGFGAQPPVPDWALMMREDLAGAVLNPAAVLAPAVALTVLACGIAVAAGGVGGRRTR